MANTVRVDDLSDVIMNELRAYSSEISEGMKEDARVVAKECLKDIKENAPELTKDYKKSWKMETTEENACVIKITIHSKKEYRLTHLLEYGHAKINGGRVEARPHIRPAEQRAEKRLLKRVQVTISGSD